MISCASIHSIHFIYTWPLSCRLYNKMTMEVILSAAFGRSVNVQEGKGGKLYESAVAVFHALNPKDNEPLNVFKVLQVVECKWCLVHY